MNNKCKVLNDQTILLGNHVAADGEAKWDAVKKSGQSYIAISHIHNDHFKESKVNNAMESPQYIEPIMSQGTRDLLMQSKVLNLRFNSHKVLKFGIEESLVTKNGETVKVTLKDSKHILGSSQIQVEETDGSRYGYSGDFGEGIEDFIDVDTLVLDSTNGTRNDLVNWTVNSAIQELAERVSEAVNEHRKVAIIGAPGLLQSTIHNFSSFLDGVDVGTYEWDELHRVSRVQAFSQVYSDHGFEQPLINSYHYAENEGLEDIISKFRFSPNQLILAHNIKDIGLGGVITPTSFEGVIFNVKNFYRHNEKPIVQRKDNNIYDVSLTSHALGDTILEYVESVNPKLVLTDSSRNEKCAMSLAKKIKDRLNIEAIPSSDLLS